MSRKVRIFNMAMCCVIASFAFQCGISSLLDRNKSEGLSSVAAGLAAFVGGGDANTASGGGDAAGASRLIPAATGGIIHLGDEVSLSIPPGSLEKDTVISIERIASSPDGAADGFSRFGQAYRFGPPGTTFAPDRPAVLTMKYDAAAARAKGLDPNRMQVYYFDEGMGRYINVANSQDLFSGTLTARIEHFTVYLPVALSATATNAAPMVMSQDPVPTTIRAGAPVYLRYTIHDKDPVNTGTGYNGGSIASAEVCVTKIVSGAQTCRQLAPEKIADPTYSPIATEDTWGVLLDTTFWSADPTLDVDNTVAADLAFEVRVTDNLNNTTTFTPPALNVPRLYDATMAAIQVDSPLGSDPVTSGFSRTFRVRARDNANQLFTMIPNPSDVSITNQIGSAVVQPSTGTIIFTGEKRDVGNLTAFFGPRNVTQSITVTNGPMTRIEILDTNGLSFTAALAADGQSTYAFDVLGYDAFGNFIQVLPDWTADPLVGSFPVSNNGELAVSNNGVSGRVTATLGALSDTQDVVVTPRYSVGGNATGITGNVTLVNGADTLVVTADGAYQFPVLNPAGTAYDVRVQSQPTNTACHPVNGQGSQPAANVVNADINCLALFGGRVDTVPTLADMADLQAGDGGQGFLDGVGSLARFNRAGGITADGRFLYVADGGNHVIRRVDINTKEVITIAGQPGIAGHADGAGSAALFNSPNMITTDGTNLYVTDRLNHVVRKIVIATGDVTTFAGGPGVFAPFQNGIGAAATFHFPSGITTDGVFLYVSETGNNVIRRIEIATRNVSTLTGVVSSGGFVDGAPSVTRFNEPVGMDTDGTFLYVADRANFRVRRVEIASGNVITLAGNGSSTSADNPAGTMASFIFPESVLLLGGLLYVSDNSTIRTVNVTTTETLLYGGTPGAAGSTNGPVASALFNGVRQMTTDGNTIYIADFGANRIRRVD